MNVGEKAPQLQPYKTKTDQHRVSIPSVRPVLIRWIRRRCYRYPYFPAPFSLAVKGLGVRIHHFSVFGRLSSPYIVLRLRDRDPSVFFCLPSSRIDLPLPLV